MYGENANCCRAGYWSEKLVNAVLAHSVPMCDVPTSCHVFSSLPSPFFARLSCRLQPCLAFWSRGILVVDYLSD